MKRSAAVSECSRARITNVLLLVGTEGHLAYVPFIWDPVPLTEDLEELSETVHSKLPLSLFTVLRILNMRSILLGTFQVRSIALPLYGTTLDSGFLELTHLPWLRLSTHGNNPRCPLSPAPGHNHSTLYFYEADYFIYLV